MNEKFYQKTWFCILMMFCCCFPLGIFLMWKYKKFKKPIRVVISSFFAIIIIATIVNGQSDSKIKNEIAESSVEKITSTEETVAKETEELKIKNNKADFEKDSEILSSTEGAENMIGLPEKYVESFNSACGSCGLELQKLNNFKKLADWNNGERYSFEYNGNIYLLYLMDTGEVMSISDSATRTKIYEYNSASGGTKDNCITLKYGEIGEYGKEEDFDGYKEIRYYIPSGAYTVKCQTRGSGLYLESIETHLEDGYKTSDVLKDIKFSSTNEEYEIEVSDGACVTLLLNSIIELYAK